MKIAMLACTVQAYQQMKRLKAALAKEQPEYELYTAVKCSALPEELLSKEQLSEEFVAEKRLRADESITDWTREWFAQADAMVFFTATGIAVRSIAPYLTHKSKDPAVLVIDETGRFCISLLSGHAGGANELAEYFSRLLGAEPVITTASDREGKISLDEFARKNDLYLTDWQKAKELAVKILAGERLGIYTGLPVEGGQTYKKEMPDNGTLPEQLYLTAYENADVCISDKKEEIENFPGLCLIPKRIVAGVGCRRGTPAEKINAAIQDCLAKNGLAAEALACIASIDLKKDEAGLLACAKQYQVLFATYSADRLKEIPGNFTPSTFVEQKTGVDNVCERSAVASGGRLLCRKMVYDKVTVALARCPEGVRF